MTVVKLLFCFKGHWAKNIHKNQARDYKWGNLSTGDCPKSSCRKELQSRQSWLHFVRLHKIPAAFPSGFPWNDCKNPFHRYICKSRLLPKGG